MVHNECLGHRLVPFIHMVDTPAMNASQTCADGQAALAFNSKLLFQLESVLWVVLIDYRFRSQQP